MSKILKLQQWIIKNKLDPADTLEVTFEEDSGVHLTIKRSNGEKMQLNATETSELRKIMEDTRFIFNQKGYAN